MSCLGNLLWFFTGGFFTGISWLFAGIFWCITIVGIPFGLQCFKFAKLSCFPFGKQVEYNDSACSFIVNILWIVLTGVPLAIEHACFALVLAITIIGIPFAKQHIKLAKLALMPFGTRVY